MFTPFFRWAFPAGAAAVLFPVLILISTATRLAAEGVAVPGLGHVYYETMGAGVLLALLTILLTIPLLRRMSAPGNVRFE